MFSQITFRFGRWQKPSCANEIFLFAMFLGLKKFHFWTCCLVPMSDKCFSTFVEVSWMRLTVELRLVLMPSLIIPFKRCSPSLPRLPDTAQEFHPSIPHRKRAWCKHCLWGLSFMLLLVPGESTVVRQGPYATSPSANPHPSHLPF